MDLLTYPYIKKESFDELQLENKNLRKNYDKLYAELNSISEMFDNNLLDLNKLIELSITKKNKIDEKEVDEIKQRLKDVSNIERLSELTSNNIKLKVDVNNKTKEINNLSNNIKQLQEEIKEIQEEQQDKTNKIKQSIYLIRNIDEIMKERLKENEQLEFKNNNLKKLNEQLQKELTKKAYKLGYIGEEEQKPMLVYMQQDNKLINNQLKTIKKLMSSRIFRNKKQEKAKRLLFDVRQSISLMPEQNQKIYENVIKQFDGVLNEN